MESLEATYRIDDLLNFNIADVDDDGYAKPAKRPRNGFSSVNVNVNGRDSVASSDVLESHEPGLPYPECAEEEELEWQYEFPSVDTFLDITSVHKQQSPVSVLENSNSSTSSSTSTNTNGSTITNNGNSNSIIMSCCGSLRVPVRARSKRRARPRDILSKESWWAVGENVKTLKRPVATKVISGRKCQHCGTEKTPQWRAGPMGPKSLCNACGVRYKSGRLVPEYRPANSPTFSDELHSNSHRKVIEMRRQKQLMGIELEVVPVKPCG